MLAERFAVQGSRVQRQRLFFEGQVLKDSKTPQDYNLKEGDTIYRLAQDSVPTRTSRKEVEPSVQVVLGNSKCPPELLSVIEGCQTGLAKGLAPVLASSGLGGTYFLRN